ncbi:hypothetical protein P153DRAFT_397112 [Dothidotthia symphoricarpi CBS 119687]|uniref:Uncharacterized protein n=1 Tax=Dothidotthia symphoricarpi CBS 119687 TaxID=1392245 RepID=A0A6A6AER0_9PLEO|nr:uncharacterized protein P153DRAFT_397112 [Dothidotthia symphoricarpi CBS 119687]KAF2128891.1 hypothetical protein P153DRAFT_397112 [Dothidotthia symphoricarpi CBS 119687]
MHNPTTLPPDVAEARKTRINEDLILCFARVKGPTPSSAQGIGLYTHIAGPHRKAQPTAADPEFLPIGGPRRIGRECGLEAETSAEIKNLWDEVQRVVGEEEGGVKAGMGVRELGRRYGALEVPAGEGEVRRSDMEGGPTHSTMRGDVAMGDLAEKATPTTTTTTKTGNMYEASRDPRRRRL